MATPGEIAERRKSIQALERKGVRSPELIAERLKIPQRTVERDLHVLNAAFQSLEEAAYFRLAMKRQQVAAAEERYVELEAEWQRSKLNKEKERAKEVTAGAETEADPKAKKDASKGKAPTKRTETQAESEGRLGDVACMREMRENDKYVAGLLGLIVDKHEVSGKDGKDLGWNHADTLELFALVDAHDRAKRLEDRSAKEPAPQPEKPA